MNRNFEKFQEKEKNEKGKMRKKINPKSKKEKIQINPKSEINPETAQLLFKYKSKLKKKISIKKCGDVRKVNMWILMCHFKTLDAKSSIHVAAAICHVKEWVPRKYSKYD